MTRSRAIAVVKRLKVARCAAVLLIALAVSPWTAPFASVDLAEIGETAQAKDGEKPLQDVKDVSDGVVTLPFAPERPTITRVHAVDCSVAPSVRHRRAGVLRI